MMNNVTDKQLEQLRLHAVNDVTRPLMTGVHLTHEQADALGEETLAWIRGRLGLYVVSDSDGVTCAAVEAHGESEGRKDYLGRAGDVAGGEDPTWAWPLDGADDAYLSAVGVTRICKDLGIDVGLWDRVSDAWLTAFARGYTDAHESAE